MKFSEKAYSALLDRIFAITPSVQNAGFTGSSYKPGLDGMKRFDALLGHPWQSFRTIHVAGTNGKGSVSSMLASVLASAPAGSSPIPGKEFWKRPGSGGLPSGAAIGLYTSPHLMDFRERMKVITDDGWTMPSKEEVWEFFQTFDTSGLSFFEMTTGMALWWFRRQKVDLAVIEAGLGGRLDSTNIIAPDLCIITSIGLDHCALLGNTRAEIAAEKAGIFKPGVPALVASEDDETAPVFRKAAEAAGAPLFFADSAPEFSEEEEILAGMDLQGPCQQQNLHTVLVSLNLLRQLPGAPAPAAPPAETKNLGRSFSGRTAGPDCKEIAALEKAAERTGLRGRWERLCEKPEVICDIGHNPPALELNFARLRAMNRPLTIVYGIMADKDLAGIAPLMPPAEYILVAPDIPRAMPAGVLRERLSALRPDLPLQTAPSVAEGISLALRRAPLTPDSIRGPLISGTATAREGAGPLIYIGGSTFVVTAAIEYFNNRQP